MFKYDQNHPNKFFSQYNRTKDLVYFYNNINNYIINNKTVYDVFFKNNSKKLLQFFLCVDNIDNKEFMTFIKEEIDFINNTNENILNSFIKMKKENLELKDFIIKTLEKVKDKESLLQSISSSFLDEKKSINPEIKTFLIKCFEYLYREETYNP